MTGTTSGVEHVDVLIVGAGLSGVGAACHLRSTLPGKSLAVLESRAAIGGTWDLFRYPGVRSDSDMFTLGYRFRPWAESEAIADGPSILKYVRETAAEYGVDKLVRYGHKVVGAEWSSADARWTVTALDGDRTVVLTCDFLYANTGYYRYDQGYTPVFPGIESFRGTVVHPQFWPEDLDYAGKKVVVIGSGATAVTLVPAMAKEAEHVTMLQRSPSYVISQPRHDPLAKLLQPRLPARVAYPIIRWKNVLASSVLYKLSRRRPELVKRFIRKQLDRQLPNVDIGKHFSPSYNPWDQRLCLVPDSDLFRALRKGTASVATDTIATFDATGIRLNSGEHLDADVVVTATGLNVLVIGGISLVVDGEPVVLADRLTYKGMMLSGVPNFALTIGYTNASWTLKADLVAEYVCRVIKHLDREGYSSVTPVAPPAGEDVIPLIDLDSGYLLRAADMLPKQGQESPWRLYQDYPRDVLLLRRGAVADGTLNFTRRTAKVPA